MMKKYFGIAAALFLLLGLSAPVFASQPIAGPFINSLSPVSGPVGTQVTIKGVNFWNTGISITSNGKLFASNLSSSDGITLQFTIPSGAGAYCPSGTACPMYFMQITPGDYPITVIRADGMTSNAVNFTVTSGSSLTVLSPNGGEQWAPGSTQTIRWSAPASVSHVNINMTSYYSCLYTTPHCYIPTFLYPIASNIPNAGLYSWYIPSTNLSGQYILTISDAGNSGLSDTSDAPFSITAQIGPPPPANQSPVISSVGGPTSLNVGEVGTWTIQASDPDGTYLNYSVDWGDVPSSAQGAIAPIPAPATQISTFTRSYSQAGSYKVVFTVSDNAGGSTQSSLTVAVGAQTPFVLTEGSLVQISGQSTVYLVIGGILRPFTSAVVFLARGLLWSNVQQVSSSQVSAQVISSSPVLLPDGSLMKGSSPTVFIVLGGKKYGIPSLEIFNRLGLSFKNVIILSDGDAQSYPDGGIQY